MLHEYQLLTHSFSRSARICLIAAEILVRCQLLSQPISRCSGATGQSPSCYSRPFLSRRRCVCRLPGCHRLSSGTLSMESQKINESKTSARAYQQIIFLVAWKMFCNEIENGTKIEIVSFSIYFHFKSHVTSLTEFYERSRRANVLRLSPHLCVFQLNT